MREFLLVVPDLPPAGASPGSGLEGRPAAGLRFGPARPLVSGWRGAVARWLGRPELEASTVAAVVAGGASGAAPGANAGDARGAWLATPLHFVAGLETVHLPRDGILALAPQERESLAADFGRSLGGDRLALAPAGREAFVLRGLEVDVARTVDPVDCLGSDLVNVQPAGPGAVPLRRLMSEIEMWLHEHPVNGWRVARGARPVRALWIWGGGAWAQASPASPGGSVGVPAAAVPTRVAPCVYADDAWTRAAAQLGGARLAAEGCWPGREDFARDADVLVVARFHGEDVPDAAAFEARYLEPALAALRSGALGRLTVIGAGRSVAAAAADRYRLWRPRRDWLSALGH
ncbi:MAG: hypothetical protein MUF07_18620 [Steroidobacteraceae bacterium]|nr:hypothetical protein [Steroidobacteraceae bacterium]